MSPMRNEEKTREGRGFWLLQLKTPSSQVKLEPESQSPMRETPLCVREEQRAPAVPIPGNTSQMPTPGMLEVDFMPWKRDWD